MKARQDKLDADTQSGSKPGVPLRRRRARHVDHIARLRAAEPLPSIATTASLVKSVFRGKDGHEEEAVTEEQIVDSGYR